ncbi:MAG: ABC transporter permease [Anaerolineales bacterium]|nr:ABC transporter permease [Anaerolineales bacterium]
MISEAHSSSLTLDTWRRLKRHKLAMVGLVVAVVLVSLAILAPVVSPYDPVEMDPPGAYQGPSLSHIMGTDEYGRDLFSRILYGTRTSLSVGIISVGISLFTGTFLGLVSGYYSGAIDAIISRFMDILYAFPFILLAMVMIAILGSGIDKVMVAIGIVYMPLFARVCRGSVIGERNKTYIEAARMVGARDFRILRAHILPNVLAPLIVQATLCMSYAILAEAALSYLGLGAQPPTPSWGYMLNKGRDLLNHSAWLSIWPGLSIMIVVFSFNVLGDGLRDALDPRLKNR